MVQVLSRPVSAGAARRLEPGAVVPLLVRNWAFLLVLALGAAVRGLCLLAYHPALLFNGDSYTYLLVAQHLQPPVSRPAGYPCLLHLLRGFGHLAIVPTMQHLLGLCLGVALYLLLLQRNAPRWLAGTVAAPVLLDAYQIDIEQFVMAETVFEVLLVAALVLLLRSARPSVVSCSIVGFLLAAATLTRSVALAVVVLVAGYLLVRRLGALRLASFLVAVALPLLGYASWFHSVHGVYALEQFDGHFLWGRVEQFADCSKLSLSPQQQVLCDPTPPARRDGPNGYLYGGHSPLRNLRVPRSTADQIAGSFARQAISRQPLGYAKVVGGDVAHYFAPTRQVGARDWFNGTWLFPAPTRPEYWHVNLANVGIRNERLPAQHPSPALVGLLRSYQRFAYTPGTVLLAALVFAGGAALWRPRSRRPSRRSRAESRSRMEGARSRWDILLLVSAGLAMLVLPAATTSFDFRYLLPTLVLFPPAAGLGLVRVFSSSEREVAETSDPAPRASSGGSSQRGAPS